MHIWTSHCSPRASSLLFWAFGTYKPPVWHFFSIFMFSNDYCQKVKPMFLISIGLRTKLEEILTYIKAIKWICYHLFIVALKHFFSFFAIFLLRIRVLSLFSFLVFFLICVFFYKKIKTTLLKVIHEYGKISNSGKIYSEKQPFLKSTYLF